MLSRRREQEAGASGRVSRRVRRRRAQRSLSCTHDSEARFCTPAGRRARRRRAPSCPRPRGPSQVLADDVQNAQVLQTWIVPLYELVASADVGARGVHPGRDRPSVRPTRSSAMASRSGRLSVRHLADVEVAAGFSGLHHSALPCREGRGSGGERCRRGNELAVGATAATGTVAASESALRSGECGVLVVEIFVQVKNLLLN